MACQSLTGMPAMVIALLECDTTHRVAAVPINLPSSFQRDPARLKP